MSLTSAYLGAGLANALNPQYGLKRIDALCWVLRVPPLQAACISVHILKTFVSLTRGKHDEPNSEKTRETQIFYVRRR